MRRCAGLLFLAGVLTGTPLAGAQSGAAATAVLVVSGDSLRQHGELLRAIETFRQALAADTNSAPARFHLAYALLAADRVAEAITTFHEGLVRDPGFRDGFRQLGYLYSSAGENDRAFSAFVSAQPLPGGLTPRDWVEVGYIQARRGNAVAARDAFTTAIAQGDSTVRSLAQQAIQGLGSSTSIGQPAARLGRSTYMELYAAPLYQTRFTNAIAQGFFRIGWRSSRPAGFSPYLTLRVTRDSRSTGGASPAIYSDNSLVPAVGIRVTPVVAGPTFYGEGGPAIMLIDDGRGPRLRPDVRVGASYAHGWWQSSDLRTELYVDASYYSRFDRDVITYVQLRELMTIVTTKVGSVEMFARLGGVFDSKRVSYNNAVEVAPGIAFAPGKQHRVVLSLERVSGRYLIAAFPGSATSYGDLRAMAVFYASVTLPHRAR